MSITYANQLFGEDADRNFRVAMKIALGYFLFFAGLATLVLFSERFAWPAFILCAAAAPMVQVMLARITRSS